MYTLAPYGSLSTGRNLPKGGSEFTNTPDYPLSPGLMYTLAWVGCTSTTDKYDVDVILHIGKTGGSFIGIALDRMGADPHNQRLFPHSMTARIALTLFPKCRIVFSVREPSSLFISGFNSRLRKGWPLYDPLKKRRPLHDLRWSRGEAAAFARFRTPDQLASALYRKPAAAAAMQDIHHVRAGLKHHLHSVDFLEKNRARIGYIMEQPTLDEDIRRYAELSGLDTSRFDPAAIARHETPPGFETYLSPAARSNLEQWYAEDLQIYQWCRSNKAQINGS